MEENNSNVYAKEISILKILQILRKTWVYILIVTLLFSVIAAVYTTKFVEEKYSSTVKFYILSDRINGQLGNELTAAKTLVDSYTVVLKHSDSFLQNVADEAGIRGTSAISRVRSMISTGAIEDTEAFYVRVTSTDRDLAYEVAKAVEIYAPEEIINIVEAGSVKVLNPPLPAVSAEGPSLVRNVMLGAIIGFILSAAFFIIANMFDNHIRTEEELAAFGLPILGSIPTIEVDSNKKKSSSSVKKA